MRLNVTPIGSGRLSAGQVAKAVVEYLAGVAKELPGPGVTEPAQLDGPSDVDLAAGYYADTIEGPGTWLGMGAAALGLGGVVGREAFARVLEGRHPVTGERLLRAQGAADRAHLAVGQATRRGDDGTWLYGLDDAAKALGLPRPELDELVAEGDAHAPAEDSESTPWVRAIVDDNGDRWVISGDAGRLPTLLEEIAAWARECAEYQVQHLSVSTDNGWTTVSVTVWEVIPGDLVKSLTEQGRGDMAASIANLVTEHGVREGLRMAGLASN